MKNIKPIIFLLIVILSITISCKKKESTPEAPTGPLQIHLHTNVGSHEVDSLGFPYKDTTGRQVVVDTAQLYISNIQLIGANNAVAYSVTNKVIFKIQPLEPYTVGQVPVGVYQSVKYDVGLDSATNAIVPNASDSALYQPTMYLNGGSNPQPGGYTFIYFSGYIDTTTDMTGNWQNNKEGFRKFSYKLGSNKNLGTITMPTAVYTVAVGSLQEIHMIIDYATLFTGVDVTKTANLTINSGNESTLGKQVSQNIVANVFVRYEY